MTSPREANVINAKLQNGEVKADHRFPAKLKKPPVFVAQPEAEVPAAKNADKKEDKKKSNAKPEKQPKAKGKKAEPLTFPATIQVNHYGFINIRKPLLEALGWSKDMTLSIVKNEDGSATVTKGA